MITTTLTKRQYYAAQAISKLPPPEDGGYSEFTDKCFAIADAIVEAEEKRESETKASEELKRELRKISMELADKASDLLGGIDPSVGDKVVKIIPIIDRLLQITVKL